MLKSHNIFLIYTKHNSPNYLSHCFKNILIYFLICLVCIASNFYFIPMKIFCCYLSLCFGRIFFSPWLLLWKTTLKLVIYSVSTNVILLIFCSEILFHFFHKVKILHIYGNYAMSWYMYKFYNVETWLSISNLIKNTENQFSSFLKHLCYYYL